MGKALVAKLGLQGPGLLGTSNFGDMYIDRSLSPADQKRLLAAAVAAYRAHPQVEAVFTADELAATPVPTSPPDQWTLIQRARASFYPGRSGDFVVFLKKDITPIAVTTSFVATHGSPWDYDRGCRSCSGAGSRGRDGGDPGRDHRHHADAGGDDRLAGRPRFDRRQVPRRRCRCGLPALTI